MITQARQLIMLSLARFITLEQEKLMSDPTIADNKPYCDGSHKQFADDQVGNPGS